MFEMDGGKIAAYMPLFALIVTIMLTMVTAVLVFAAKVVPDEIKTGDALAYAWFFISSAQRGTTPPTPPKGGSDAD